MKEGLVAQKARSPNQPRLAVLTEYLLGLYTSDLSQLIATAVGLLFEDLGEDFSSACGAVLAGS